MIELRVEGRPLALDQETMNSLLVKADKDNEDLSSASNSMS
jgi:hypothetical protein